MILEGLLYTESHEWVKVEGNVAYVGISDHAQHALGNIVFIELPEVGLVLKKGESFGAIESVKAASDVYLPVSGKIIEVNHMLEDQPESINDDPYGSWICKIEITNQSELSALLSSEQYQPLCED
jgi:glycine cleavage system H protein